MKGVPPFRERHLQHHQASKKLQYQASLYKKLTIFLGITLLLVIIPGCRALSVRRHFEEPRMDVK